MGLFGIWDVVQDMGVSFSTSEHDLPEYTSWRIDLPADQVQADIFIGRAEIRLIAAQSGLEAAGVRFDPFVRQVAGGVHFDAGDQGSEFTPADQETAALIWSLRTRNAELDFDLDPEAKGKWAQITQQFQSFLKQVEKTISHYAWVETRIDNESIVQTIVDWNGSFKTTWQKSPDKQLIGLHERSLKLTLASRAAMMRTLAVLSAGAMKLSSILVMPGGAILALPVAFNYIRQVQAEIVGNGKQKEKTDGE